MLNKCMMFSNSIIIMISILTKIIVIMICSVMERPND